MIEARIARSLVSWANDPHEQDAFMKYIQFRIDSHYTTLRTSNDINDLMRAQGAIAELERFKLIREEINSSAKG